VNDAINIDSLLKSDTYQNMSDEEIQALIDYRVERARKDAVISSDYKAHERLMQRLLDAQELAVSAANDAFNKAIETASAYKEVD
jgi:hypothetical protein